MLAHTSNAAFIAGTWGDEACNAVGQGYVCDDVAHNVFGRTSVDILGVPRSICEVGKTWFQARDACVAEGGRRTIIDDGEENEALATAAGVVLDNVTVWIGASDAAVESTWLRVDGLVLDDL